MSLTLQESCQLYERHARRHKAVLTFSQFNQEHYTCLPDNAHVETEFLSAVSKARKAEGVPIRGRLCSLYRKLNRDSVSPVAQKVEAVPAPASKSYAVHEPKYEKAMRMNIRPPEAAPEAQPEQWTMDAYVQAVQDSGLAEAKGLMVHFMPEQKGEPLSSLASKLTKTTWDVIRGKSDERVIKMKDGTLMDVSACTLNAEDVSTFVRNRKKKVEGPYFIRFSRI
tara:strand:+ start:604 stop:1275 length:672 start_codon:yes stop_codon:yes gene_type:complete